MSKKHTLRQLIEKPARFQEESWNSRFWLDKIPDYFSSRDSLRAKTKNSNSQTSVNRATDSLNTLISSQKNSSNLNFPSIYPAIPETLYQKRNTANHVIHNRISYQCNPKIRASHPEMKPISKNFVVRRPAKQRFLTSTKPLKPLSSLKTLPTEAENLNNQIQDISVSKLSDSSESNLEFELSLVFHEVILSEFLSSLLSQIGTECINEGILAYLTLSSGKILYFYINEVLDSLIPYLAKSWYEEFKEKEPSSLRDQISEIVKDEEIARIVQSITLNMLASSTVDKVLNEIPLSSLIQDCLKEIAVENKEKELDMLEYLIESVLSEDWIEVLVEDTVTSIRLEGIWKLFPVYLQKEISQNQHSIIVESISEDIYFDILNKDLALFLEEICNEELALFIFN